MSLNSIESFVVAYDHGICIAAENTAKLAGVAVVTATCIQKGLTYFFANNSQANSQDAKTRNINIVSYAGAALAAACTVKRLPLTPLSTWQMNAMGITSLALFAIGYYFPNNDENADFIDKYFEKALLAIPLVGFGVSATCRLIKLVQNR